jgi:hypothetical protein
MLDLVLSAITYCTHRKLLIGSSQIVNKPTTLSQRIFIYLFVLFASFLLFAKILSVGEPKNAINDWLGPI